MDLSGTMEGEKNLGKKINMSRGGVRKTVQSLGPETQEGTRDEAEKSKLRTDPGRTWINGLNLILNDLNLIVIHGVFMSQQDTIHICIRKVSLAAR